MYQESNNNNTINWLKIIVKILLVFLLVILSAKLISMVIHNKGNSDTKSNMESNLKIMMTTAKEYFTEENLPKTVGKSAKVDLNSLIKEKLITSIKDNKGNKCNYEESFIKATKLDKEYQIKAYLVCGSETDYLNDFIKFDEIDNNDKTTTKKPVDTTTKKTTTKKTTSTKVNKTTSTTTKKTTTSTTNNTTTKVTTTKKVTTSKPVKKYTVTFNSNGGNTINSVKVRAKDKVEIPTNPTRSGYKFIGWYYHGERFDFNTKIEQDYILIAKWIK